MNKEELTKEDILNVTGSMFNTFLDYVDNSNNELEQLEQKYKEVIDKAIEWIYIAQQNKDNKHLEPIINTDRLDELLEILKGDSNE